jgi:CRISPR/Cas system-associated exonuclease Cas4 (RecB family)
MSPVTWSFSAIKEFETCPRKYYASRVEKLYPFQQSAASKYGNEVHEACELYIRDGTPMPGNMAHLQPQLDSLNGISGDKHCEIKMAVTENLEVCDFDDENRWVRGIADLVIVNRNKAFVVDYKTGSAKYPDKGQLELMALLVFKHFPEVKKIKAALIFMVHNTVIKDSFTLKGSDKRWQKWKARSELLDGAFENDNWPPKSNGLCKSWCPVEHCEYHGS